MDSCAEGRLQRADTSTPQGEPCQSSWRACILNQSLKSMPTGFAGGPVPGDNAEHRPVVTIAQVGTFTACMSNLLHLSACGCWRDQAPSAVTAVHPSQPLLPCQESPHCHQVLSRDLAAGAHNYVITCVSSRAWFPG